MPSLVSTTNRVCYGLLALPVSKCLVHTITFRIILRYGMPCFSQVNRLIPLPNMIDLFLLSAACLSVLCVCLGEEGGG